MNILTFIIVGLIAGWVASVVIKGYAFGTTGNILVGVVGAFIGGVLFDAFNMQDYGFLGAVLMATLGAAVFLAIAGLFPRVPGPKRRESWTS